MVEPTIKELTQRWQDARAALKAAEALEREARMALNAGKERAAAA